MAAAPRDYQPPRPRHRFRALTRYPLDRDARIETCLVDIGVAAFCQRASMAIPDDWLRRANRGRDVLCGEGVRE